MPPPFPIPEHGNGIYVPPLSLNTNIPPGTAASPRDFPGNSYFSPTNDSPTSTRSTSQQSFSQFTRQQTAAGHWPHEENKHRTAPAIGRALSCEGPASPNSYVVSGRTVIRPSLPAMAASQNPQEQLIQQSCLRSASTLERTRLVEKQRLLEKAKMKGRKGKKGNKKNVNSATHAHQPAPKPRYGQQPMDEIPLIFTIRMGAPVIEHPYAPTAPKPPGCLVESSECQA